jgi:hypothetical protein
MFVWAWESVCLAILTHCARAQQGFQAPSLTSYARGLRLTDSATYRQIDGHTDNTGAAAHNMAPSLQCANAVKTQLLAMGIDAARLMTKGWGDRAGGTFFYNGYWVIKNDPDCLSPLSGLIARTK